MSALAAVYSPYENFTTKLASAARLFQAAASARPARSELVRRT
nr:hypothetical protein [uncultured bacterium]